MGKYQLERRKLLETISVATLGVSVSGITTGTPTENQTAKTIPLENPQQSTTPSPEATIVPDDGDTEDQFGWSVTAEGDTALIGAPGDEDPNGPSAGSAYVFARTDTGWTQQAKLTPDDGDSQDFFGASADLAGDTALISAGLDDDPNEGDYGGMGSAYVFTSGDGAWTQQAKLAPDESEEVESVAVAGDTALLGAGRSDDSYGPAYVFVRDGGNWTQQAKLVPDDGDHYDLSGAVALSGDTALVGAGVEDVPNGNNAGAVYVFTRTGSDWHQQDKLVPEDGDTDDIFGWSVAVEGDTALIGAPGDEDPNGPSAGSAYVFTRTDTEWTQQAKLTPDDGDSQDFFGTSADLTGNTALIGADHYQVGAGVAYAFTRNSGNWTQQAKLTPDDERNEVFGWSVDMTGDTALIGSWDGDDPNGANSGSAYTFRIPTATASDPEGNTPTEDNTETPGSSGPGFGVGTALAAIGLGSYYRARSTDDE